jgi:hypothetical protein
LRVEGGAFKAVHRRRGGLQQFPAQLYAVDMGGFAPLAAPRVLKMDGDLADTRAVKFQFGYRGRYGGGFSGAVMQEQAHIFPVGIGNGRIAGKIGLNTHRQKTAIAYRRRNSGSRLFTAVLTLYHVSRVKIRFGLILYLIWVSPPVCFNQIGKK